MNAFALPLAYLVGSLPFGYLVGKVKGKNLFLEGSGNIGATNAARVLGTQWGIAVFILDFLKGALPVFFALKITEQTLWEIPQALPVGVAALAFLGHLFPVFLGFRGGKGVATGAGAACVLMPIPVLLAVLVWLLVLLCSRMVSLASLTAACVVIVVRLLQVTNPFNNHNIALTVFALVGGLLVVVKHRANVKRLWLGSESKFADGEKRQTLLRILHVVSVGLWAGGVAFFNLAAAPTIFKSFEEVVATSPSDRTARVDIVPEGADETTKKNLANALAGSAVGPIFPIFFACQTVCAVVAFCTAIALPVQTGRIRAWRIRLTGLALLTVMVSVPVSRTVSHLRILRWDTDFAIAQAATQSFKVWHFVSLGLSMITIVFVVITLALTAKLPSQSESEFKT